MFLSDSKNSDDQNKELLRYFFGTYGLVIVIGIVTIVFGFLTDWIFTSPRNVPILLRQASITGIVAVGVALVIISGEIDLSIGSAVGLCAIIVAWLMKVVGLDPIIAVPLTLTVGLLLGAWQGAAVAWFGVPSFVVTLGGLLIFRGIGLIITEGETIASFPASFLVISQGSLDNSIVTGLGAIVVGFWLLTVFRQVRNSKSLSSGLKQLVPKVGLGLLIGIAVIYVASSSIGLPLAVALMVSVALILQIVASRTRFGRRVYAIGGNREAALLAGINVNRITFLTFLLMGALYGLAGLVLASRLNGAPPGGAPFLELDAIAAAVIGGVSLRGGVGLVINALLGALLLAAINNGLSLMNVPTFYQLVVSGLILIIAVFLDSRAKAKT
ncbi:MAG TPA: sugar ABC transporter permease [Candidatus Lambdaproteobacteria bacterium]|nr:sugar ABC transporter permease [Candidatus Lambdaproteobacteria bacterium]